MSKYSIPVGFTQSSSNPFDSSHPNAEVMTAAGTKSRSQRNAPSKSKRSNGNDDSTKSHKVSLNSVSHDDDVYSNGNGDKDAYSTSIALRDDDDMEEETQLNGKRMPQFTATQAQMNELVGAMPEDDILVSREQEAQIQSRQTGYQKRQYERRELSPTRVDASGEVKEKSYREKMQEKELEREEARVAKLIEEKRKQAGDEAGAVQRASTPGASDTEMEDATDKGDQSEEDDDLAQFGRRWIIADTADPPADNKKRQRNEDNSDEEDELSAQTPETEPDAKKARSSRWETTETVEAETISAAAKKRSRWDIAPAIGSSAVATGPAEPSQIAPFGSRYSTANRNAPLSDEELNQILPGPEQGYQILSPPPGHTPLPGRAPTQRLGAPAAEAAGFRIPSPTGQGEFAKGAPAEPTGVGDLQFYKPEDQKYFGKLSNNVNENELSVAELKERKIMRLLLKVKNGTPAMRKTALRQLTDGARSFGPQALFDQLLPLLMERTLEDQERHLLVKVVDRILYKLDDQVRPFTHKILIVIEPLLIDSDYYARVEGREIISNLAKAAGLANMISTMRPDIDSPDEFVRNTTSRAFAVVATALGIPALMPFVKAVCHSKKSWQARHTGVKIVQQCAVSMGCAILPHLKGLVSCIVEGLNDEQAKVRTITAIAISSLAEAAAPYGIESFDDILKPLWAGARKQRGKGLAAFIQAVGNVIVLMDEEFANYYTSQIMEILRREFSTSEDDMKRVVLKVLSQCAATKGVTSEFLRENVLDEFFKNFWVRRMAADRRNVRQVIDTTVELSRKVGLLPVLRRICENLKDMSEPFRKMTVETIEKMVNVLGVGDIDEVLENQLIDGMIVSFQQQTADDNAVLHGFGTVVNALGERMKPYLPQMTEIIKHRMRDKKPELRQQAAELIGRVAKVMSICGHDELLQNLGTVLDENLGEEYPETLASILGALRSIFLVLGVASMQPPIRSLIPKLTPVLKNRHEKVQENVIDLVGRIADRGPESVNAREWIRICFDLLDMLKAHKKGIRRASNNTFGFIAKAIGPSDVLSVLLNNLRVQERQSRVCTAVAIGIVAESCSPYTVLPSLMNEYRVPELNVQTGVLKALSFLFEYIGEMSKDYVYAITPLLEDALMDRDQVHRQTAASVVKHIALGVVGLGCEGTLHSSPQCGTISNQC